MTDQSAAKSKAIDGELLPIRTRLDQLVEQAVEEGINITRQTTEALTTELTTLMHLEEEAVKTKNTRLIAAVRKERDRARQGLGLKPRRRRR